MVHLNPLILLVFFPSPPSPLPLLTPSPHIGIKIQRTIAPGAKGRETTSQFPRTRLGQTLEGHQASPRRPTRY